MEQRPLEILAETGIEIHPDEYFMISISKSRWPFLLENNALSPSGRTPFLIFSDAHEVTLVLNLSDFENLRPGLDDSRVERGLRLLTFTVEMDFSVVGFIAEVSRILAAAQVSIIPISSFSRDHLLIRQSQLADALKALGPAVRELC